MYMCKSLRNAKLNQSRARQNQTSVLSLGIQNTLLGYVTGKSCTRIGDVSVVRQHIYARPSSLCRSCTELMEERLLSTLYSLRDSRCMARN